MYACVRQRKSTFLWHACQIAIASLGLQPASQSVNQPASNTAATRSPTSVSKSAGGSLKARCPFSPIPGWIRNERRHQQNTYNKRAYELTNSLNSPTRGYVSRFGKNQERSGVCTRLRSGGAQPSFSSSPEQSGVGYRSINATHPIPTHTGAVVVSVVADE